MGTTDINSSISNHLRKYFELACSRFEHGDRALATFFALTLIEECAKILILRDADLQNENERHLAIDHREKHWTAFVNLLSSSEKFDTLPKQWQEEIWSLFVPEGKKASQIRNNSLYLRFDRKGKLTTPDQLIKADHAALLVYLSGFVAHELEEYVDIEKSWAQAILQRAEDFRARHLKS